jgi:hypothetical protein
MATPVTQGLVMRLDAAALELADGAAVDQWPDLSGLGHHAVQTDPERQPTYVASGTPFGEPVVRFSGVAPFEHMLVNQMGPYPVPYTIFIVWKINQNTGGDQQALDGVVDGERVRIGYQFNPSRIFAWSGGTFPNLEKAMAVPFENYLMTVAVYDDTGGLFRVNGELEHENVTGNTSLSGFTIGRRFTDAQQLAGDIAEILVYSRRLSETEIDEVEAYLDGKWLRDPDDTGPPTVPQDFAVYAGAAFAHLSWSASTDDSGQVVYRVERNGEVIAGSVSSLNYVDRSVSPDSTYTYSVRAADLSNNVSDPSPSIEVSTKSLEMTVGSVKAEFYTGISGTAITDLTSAAKYPNEPDAVLIFPSLETPSGWGDNYGARVSGWFLPPQSARYVFFLASDDQGHFYLSTDASPANLHLVAVEPGWNPVRDWIGTERRDPVWPENRTDRFLTEWPEKDGNEAAIIDLVQGQRYYFEALVKEGTGGDHLGVTFKLESEEDPANGTPSRLTGAVIESEGDPEMVPPMIVTQPQARLVPIGQPATLNVVAEADTPAPIFYEWFKDGVQFPSATGPALTISSFQETDEGTYHVVVTTAGGSVTSQAAFLRVQTEVELITEGLVVRLDATALELTDGAPVANWPDISGVGNHAVQADEERRPTFIASGTPFGEPVVRFSGAVPLEHLVIEQMGPYPVPYTTAGRDLGIVGGQLLDGRDAVGIGDAAERLGGGIARIDGVVQVATTSSNVGTARGRRCAQGPSGRGAPARRRLHLEQVDVRLGGVGPAMPRFVQLRRQRRQQRFHRSRDRPGCPASVPGRAAPNGDAAIDLETLGLFRVRGNVSSGLARYRSYAARTAGSNAVAADSRQQLRGPVLGVGLARPGVEGGAKRLLQFLGSRRLGIAQQGQAGLDQLVAAPAAPDDSPREQLVGVGLQVQGPVGVGRHRADDMRHDRPRRGSSRCGPAPR